MKKFLKQTLNFFFNKLGYSIKRINKNREMFEFPRDFFPIEMNDIQKKIIRESEKFSMHCSVEIWGIVGYSVQIWCALGSDNIEYIGYRKRR